jgi:hypothetical protein
VKIFVGRCFVVVCISVSAAFVFAGEFKSRIITTSPLTITVLDDHFLRIWNFTQEGGGVDPGIVTVTINGQTANVLTASRIDTSTSTLTSPTPEIINQVVIAGPAQVTVAPVAGATLFITYRKLPDEPVGHQPAATPAPTATATATPTPTPTPTP